MRYRLLTALLCTLITGLAAAEPDEQAPASKEQYRSAIDRRFELEATSRTDRFAITPHRPTYVLPLTYNARPNDAPYDPQLEPELQRQEIKFQLSFKIPLAKGTFFGYGDLGFGYTQLSFWQAYNGDYSSPFRETNHEPELMLSFRPRFKILGMEHRSVTVALDHQSNGRGGPVSRSWNRVTLESIFERGPWYLSIRPWWRIPEDPNKDDNPDIETYMGHFELRVLREVGRESFGLMVRNNLRSENRGAGQFDWTFPLSKGLQGYVQYFNGYGESLIDYNHYSNRIGIGVMLSNWL